VILVDTSIWIDHLHHVETTLVSLLDELAVVVHPMVIGELALGSMRDRAEVLRLLAALASTPVATHEEVLALVEARALHGVGLSLVDAHLLAAALLSPGTQIWTRDRRLHAAAQRLGLAASV
jgi:predicted nucleic acid-binding protein